MGISSLLFLQEFSFDIAYGGYMEDCQVIEHPEGTTNTLFNSKTNQLKDRPLEETLSKCKLATWG